MKMINSRLAASRATKAAKGKTGNAAVKAAFNILSRQAGAAATVEKAAANVFVFRNTRLGPFVMANGVVHSAEQVPARQPLDKSWDVFVPAGPRGPALAAGAGMTLRRNPAGREVKLPTDAKQGDFVHGRWAFLLPAGSLILNPADTDRVLFNQGSARLFGTIDLANESWGKDIAVDSSTAYLVLLRGSESAKRSGAPTLANAARIQMSRLGIVAGDSSGAPVAEIPMAAPVRAAPAPAPRKKAGGGTRKVKGVSKNVAIGIIDAIAVTGDADEARAMKLGPRTKGSLKVHYGVSSVAAAIQQQLDAYNGSNLPATTAAPKEIKAAVKLVKAQKPAEPAPVEAPAPAAASDNPFSPEAMATAMAGLNNAVAGMNA
jgi:hypothetical protein